MIYSNEGLSSFKAFRSTVAVQVSTILDQLAAPSKPTSNNYGENTSFLKKKCSKSIPPVSPLMLSSKAQDTSLDFLT